MSGHWIAIGRRFAAIILTIVVITLLPLEHLPLRASGAVGYWFVFIAGIVVMLVIAGLIFKAMGIGFWRGIMEWIFISIVLAGLFAVLFPVAIGGGDRQLDEVSLKGLPAWLALCSNEFVGEVRPEGESVVSCVSVACS